MTRSHQTMLVSVVGSVCIALALTLAGYILAGPPGQLVGLLITVPASISWGYYWGRQA